MQKIKFQIRSCDTYLRLFGKPENKKILLFLHGWNLQGAINWEPLLEDLGKQGFLIICPDMPGFGKSSEPSSDWLALDYALWLNNLVQKLKEKNILKDSNEFYLSGHSFGGGVVSVYSSKVFVDKYLTEKEYLKPDKLFLFAPAIIRRPANKKQRLTQKITKLIKIPTKLILKGQKPKLLSKIYYKLIGSPDYNQTSGRMRQIMQKVIRQDLQEYLPWIKIPTILMWGDKDTYTPYKDAKIVAEQINDSKLITAKNVNHGLHLHAKDQILALF